MKFLNLFRKKVVAPSFIICGDQVTLVIDAVTHVIDTNHANHAAIFAAIKKEDWKALTSLVDIPTAINIYTKGKIKVNAFGEVEFDGHIIENSVATRIKDFFDRDLPYRPLICFLENLLQNPSSASVEELYRFLENEGMPITEDGCFIGYRGVTADFKDKHTGNFDNSPGQVLDMERDLVDPDTRVSCGSGFHVGSHKYASSWGAGGNVVLVKVNPRDAVSVPHHDAEKLRVCHYEVLSVCDGLLQEPLHEEPVRTQEDVCEDCYELTEDCCCEDFDDYHYDY